MLASISFPNLGLSVDPDRVAFSIGDFQIYWYGIIIACGFLLAVLYAFRRSKEFGLTPDNIIDAMIFAVPAAIIGARLYYVLFNFPIYFGANATKSAFDIRDGGLAIYGGVIATVLTLAIYTRVKKHKLTPYLDVASMGLLIGQCVGRWGNFFNREAFGNYTDGLLAMRLSTQDIGGIDPSALAVMTQKAEEGGYAGFVQVHPTFLYESVWNLVGFVLIHFLSKKRKFDGQVFLMYLCWYGLGRVWIEGLRTDSLMWGGIRISQLLAGLCAVAAGGLLIYNRFRPHDPEKMFVRKVAAAKAAQEAQDDAAQD